jgi:uracil-DNA glycosylase
MNTKDKNMNKINFEKEVEKIISQLKNYEENPISKELGFVPPYNEAGKDIKLIIIGQDPTIKNEKQRSEIKFTLNLDKSGAIRKYVEDICEGLNISLSNVYATNLFKYFYTIPPAQTFDVMEKHLEPNLTLLKKELAGFANCPIITLGEPVLKLLVGNNAKVREYWGYDKKTGKTNGKFKYVSANDNKLNRIIFPFCHQPSIRKDFYKNALSQYVDFVKGTTL